MPAREVLPVSFAVKEEMFVAQSNLTFIQIVTNLQLTGEGEAW